MPGLRHPSLKAPEGWVQASETRRVDSVPKSTKPTTGPGMQRDLLPLPPYPQTMLMTVNLLPQHPQPLPNPRSLFLGSSSFSSSSLCFLFVLLVTCYLFLPRCKWATFLPSHSLAFLCVCFALSSAGAKWRDSCFRQVPYPGTVPQTPACVLDVLELESGPWCSCPSAPSLPCSVPRPLPVSTCPSFPPTKLDAPPPPQS